MKKYACPCCGCEDPTIDGGHLLKRDICPCCKSVIYFDEDNITPNGYILGSNYADAISNYILIDSIKSIRESGYFIKVE